MKDKIQVDSEIIDILDKHLIVLDGIIGNRFSTSLHIIDYFNDNFNTNIGYRRHQREGYDVVSDVIDQITTKLNNCNFTLNEVYYKFDEVCNFIFIVSQEDFLDVNFNVIYKFSRELKKEIETPNMEIVFIPHTNGFNKDKILSDNFKLVTNK